MVLPAAFAFGLFVLDDDTFALFAGFAAFALLSFADFGGPLGRRFRAYLVFAACGAGIVALGTLASANDLAAVVVALVVVFALQQLSAFGGYWSAAMIPAVLAFVLAVMIPGSPEAVIPQAGGWAAAGMVSAVAAVVLWPTRTRTTLHHRAADVADALAHLLEDWVDDRGAVALSTDAEALTASTHALVKAWESNPLRPAGPASRDQALAYVVDEARHVVPFAQALVEAGERDPEDVQLAQRAAEVLRSASGRLRGLTVPVDVVVLAQARAVNLAAVEGSMERAIAEGRPEAAVDRAERCYALRMLVHATLTISADVLIAQGERPDVSGVHPPPTVPLVGGLGTLRRASQILRSHLAPRSAWLRTSLRGALAIAAAVAVARAIQVDHGFWVVLGTLSVLRSSLGGTASTGLRAAAGTIIGFVVTFVVVSALGDWQLAVWAVLVATTFLAAWAPRVVGFMAGQVCFTLFVVVLFNLVQPDGWRTGLVRVEDMLIGVAVALVVGVLLWPRGLSAQMARIVGSAYSAAGTYVVGSSRLALHRGDARPEAEGQMEREREAAERSVLDADAALMAALAEDAPHHLPAAELDSLLAGLAKLRHAGDAMGWVRSGFPPIRSCPAVVRSLDEALGRIEVDAAALARQLDGAPAEEEPSVRAGPAFQRDGPAGGSLGLDELMRSCARSSDSSPERVSDLLCLVFACKWVALVEQVVASAGAGAGNLGALRPRRSPWPVTVDQRSASAR